MTSYEEIEAQMDWEAYAALYEGLKQKRFKPRPDATKPDTKIQHYGPPLDFSFLKLQDVQSLRKERPRAGKRKPIEKDEDEEESKKGDAAAANGDDKDLGEKAKEVKESQVVKNTSVPAVNQILAQYSVSLSAAKNGLMGGRKPEDGKEEQKKKKEIVYSVNSLLLNNNEIRELSGLYDVLRESVLYEPEKLQWLNLSYNHLVKLDPDL